LEQKGWVFNAQHCFAVMRIFLLSRILGIFGMRMSKLSIPGYCAFSKVVIRICGY
jgi:hypothetical protein